MLSDPLADVGLHRLTETALSDWRDAALRGPRGVDRAPHLERPPGGAQRRREEIPGDASGGPADRDQGRSGIESHDQPIARDDAALPDADVRKLLDAAGEIDEEGGWDGDLHRLVVTLAATGARFSQVIRIRVGDLQAERGRLMVPVSRKGKGGKGSSHIAVRIGEDVIEVLAPATKGRTASEPLLTRWPKEQSADGFAQLEADRENAMEDAVRDRRPWLEIVKRAGLPAETVPYALRHSSIVRALGAGLPVQAGRGDARHLDRNDRKALFAGPSRRCSTTWPVRRSCRWSAGRRSRPRWSRSGADRP